MTGIHPLMGHRGMSNQFTAKSGTMVVNFRNKTIARDSVDSIEIRDGSGTLKEIVVDTDDNVAMALAILGVGRVTDPLERQARDRAKTIESDSYGADIDRVLAQAIVNLRAILIAKQREAEDSEQLIKEAYNLYKLSYPSSTKDLAMFTEQKNNRDYWVATLKRIRKDPTALDSL